MNDATCPLGEPRISVGNSGDSVLIVAELRSTRPLTATELDELKDVVHGVLGYLPVMWRL